MLGHIFDCLLSLFPFLVSLFPFSSRCFSSPYERIVLILRSMLSSVPGSNRNGSSQTLLFELQSPISLPIPPSIIAPVDNKFIEEKGPHKYVTQVNPASFFFFFRHRLRIEVIHPIHPIPYRHRLTTSLSHYPFNHHFIFPIGSSITSIHLISGPHGSLRNN